MSFRALQTFVLIDFELSELDEGLPNCLKQRSDMISLANSKYHMADVLRLGCHGSRQKQEGIQEAIAMFQVKYDPNSDQSAISGGGEQ